MKKKLIKFDDIDFVATAEIEKHSVSFEVYEIVGRYENGDLLYTRKGATCTPDTVDDLAHAQIYLHGYVKWDGCSNWSIDIAEEIMLHACDRRGLSRIGEVMARCWDYTKDNLSSFDGD